MGNSLSTELYPGRCSTSHSQSVIPVADSRGGYNGSLSSLARLVLISIIVLSASASAIQRLSPILMGTRACLYVVFLLSTSFTSIVGLLSEASCQY